MKADFWVRPYDGEGGDSLATRVTEWGPFDTLDEARDFIHERLGRRDFGSFEGPFSDYEETQGLIECWHASDQEGCGGFAIYQPLGEME
jgi:hypothetical protein